MFFYVDWFGLCCMYSTRKAPPSGEADKCPQDIGALFEKDTDPAENRKTTLYRTRINYQQVIEPAMTFRKQQ